jgi:hypothetical protein
MRGGEIVWAWIYVYIYIYVVGWCYWDHEDMVGWCNYRSNI